MNAQTFESGGETFGRFKGNSGRIERFTEIKPVPDSETGFDLHVNSLICPV